MRRSFLLFLLGLCAGVWPAAAQKQPFTVDTMLRLARISEPALSPDGTQIAFTVQRVELDKNAKPTDIYLVPVQGGTPRQLTSEGTANQRPRWPPDSTLIYFVSNRSGSSQVWSMNADGSNARQLTKFASEAEGILVSPDGKKIVFLSSVYPECGADDSCNQRKIEEEAKSKVKARIYTSLLYRHWTEWQGARRRHLMVMNADGTEIKDLTPGASEVPPFSLGGQDDYAIAPDSNEVAFVRNVDPDPATSTNSDIYVVPINGGDLKKITTGPGADTTPLYSPDGKLLAFRSQARGGYESDRWRLMVLDRATGRTTNLTENLDRWVGSVTWSPDSTQLFFTVEDRGRTGLQMIQASGGGARNIIAGPATLDDVQFTSDALTTSYTAMSGSHPLEIYRETSNGGTGVPLTHLNVSVLASSELTPLEEMW